MFLWLSAGARPNGPQITWRTWGVVQKYTVLPSAISRYPRLTARSRYSTTQVVVEQVETQNSMPLTTSVEENYWQRILLWKDVSKNEFGSYQWQVRQPI